MDGMIGTADNLSTKLGEALAAQLLTQMLARAGYNADLTVQPDAAINVINAMLGIVPAVFGGLIILVVLFLNIDVEMDKMRRSRTNEARF